MSSNFGSSMELIDYEALANLPHLTGIGWYMVGWSNHRTTRPLDIFCIGWCLSAPFEFQMDFKRE
jgi:hypothetical protein